jgi:tetratricopeptide (TPR) repeat protein
MAWRRTARDERRFKRVDALYGEAIERSHRAGDGERAEKLSAAAVARYRRLQRPGDEPLARAGRRRLALALWRQSMLVASRGRPNEALPAGREAVELARSVLEATAADDPELDAIIGETATAMNDLSETAGKAALPEERAELQQAVVALCEGRPGRRARQALGTARHNQAVVAVNAAQADIAGGGEGPETARALAIMTDAVDLRRQLVDDSEPTTLWELANSLMLRGQVRCLVGRGQSGAKDLLSAWTVLQPTHGPSVETLRAELREAMGMAEHRYPSIAGSLGWPWPVRAGRQAPGAGAAGSGSMVPGEAQAMAAALAHLERGEPRRAVDELEPLAEAGSGAAMHTLGLIFAELGEHGRADAWYRRAADAGNVDAMVVAGCKAAEAGELDDATRLLGGAAATGDPNGLFNHGMLFAQYLGRPDEALPQWEQAAWQGHALAALNLGNVLHQMGRRDEAERWHRRSAELGNVQAMHNLAATMAESGRRAEAATWLEQAHRHEGS